MKVDGYMTTEEAAAALGVSRRRIQALIGGTTRAGANGERVPIPALVRAIKVGRAYLVKVDDLRPALERNTKPGRPPGSK